MTLGYAPTTCYILTFAAIPVAFWSHDLAAARRYISLLKENSAELPHGYWHSWSQLFERIADIENSPSASFRLKIDSLMSDVHEPFIADALATFRDDFVGDIVARRVACDESGWNAPEVLRGLGCRAARENDTEKAASLFLRAMDVAKQQAALSWELRSALSLAELWTEGPQRRNALNLLNSVYLRFHDADGSGDVRKAKRLLLDFTDTARS
jgi:hypothetical protein